MRALFHTRNKRTEGRSGTGQVASSVLARVMDYAKKIEPLTRSASSDVKLIDTAALHVPGHMADAAPYYLLIFSKGEEQEYLNAGYVAGQTASYLRFQGISATVLSAPESWMQFYAQEKEQCMAAVAFGRTETAGKSSRAGKPAERPCISREYRANWAEEVLDFAKKSFPMQGGSVRILYRDNCISFLPKNNFRRKMMCAELETGIAVSNVLSAAEALWIDLTPVDTGDPRCLVSLCRKKDRAEVIRARRDDVQSQQKTALETGRHWYEGEKAL